MVKLSIHARRTPLARANRLLFGSALALKALVINEFVGLPISASPNGQFRLGANVDHQQVCI
jgi:hypothetical protein